MATPVICPHCNKTIAEQDRYLMSADGEPPAWAAPAARLLVLFLVLVAAFYLLSRAAGSF